MCEQPQNNFLFTSITQTLIKHTIPLQRLEMMYVRGLHKGKGHTNGRGYYTLCISSYPSQGPSGCEPLVPMLLPVG